MSSYPKTNKIAAKNAKTEQHEHSGQLNLVRVVEIAGGNEGNFFGERNEPYPRNKQQKDGDIG